MRSSRRPESFLARRTISGTYAGAGAATRNLLFDVFQSDQTDGKIHFASESVFRFVAKERELWQFSLVVALSGNLIANESLYAILTHSVIGTIAEATYFAFGTSANYTPSCSAIVLLNAGDVVTPQIYSGVGSGNNPSPSCEFSGMRIG